MGRRLVSDRVKDSYKKSVNKLVDDLGRSVVVHKQSVKNTCDNCNYDSLTNSSTGKCKWVAVEAAEKQAAWEAAGNSSLKFKYFIRGRCPVCNGVGYLEVLRKKYVKCIINWAPENNDLLQTPVGLTGATPVLLKTDPNNIELFQGCEKIIVDGIECVLSTPPMLRGIGNKSVLFVMAFTSKTVKEPGSKEFRKDYYGQ